MQTSDTLQRKWAIFKALDDVLEMAQRKHWSLSRLFQELGLGVEPFFRQTALAIFTFGEDLEKRLFCWPGDLNLPDDLQAALQAASGETFQKTDHWALHRLDVAGEDFGVIALFWDAEKSPLSPETLADDLEVFAEVVDNALGAVRQAALKQQALMAIQKGLQHPVLEEALALAVKALHQHAPFERLLMVFRQEEDQPECTLRLFEGPELKHIKEERSSEENNALLSCQRSHPFFQELNLENGLEQALIHGAGARVIVGRLLIKAKEDFNLTQRDMLSAFAMALRMRLVDFHKERRLLSQFFGEDHLDRLLAEDNYDQDYLSPRDKQVAILFTDISGFTRVSEQFLKEPEAIGAFVNAWSEKAVALVWEHGGVFDKMVGDCIIATFGPPFFEWTPEEASTAALRCAVAIRDMTKEMGQLPAYGVPGLPQDLPPIGVATGVNFAPLFIGRFGPNRDVTGFSSGMNNTARLQGVAKQDEILVMDNLYKILENKSNDFKFGEVREAAVKNVAEPLQFYPLV